MKSLHINTIRKILKDNKFSMALNYSNGRIRGLTSTNGDISLKNHSSLQCKNGIEIYSRKGNLKKALSVIKRNGYNVFVWKHPNGLSERNIIIL